MSYYSERDARVQIANHLRKNGWEIFGWKNNESDSMTDYYSPANWDGVATKNGFVVVVGSHNSEWSGAQIIKESTPTKKSIELHKKSLDFAEQLKCTVDYSANMVSILKTKRDEFERKSEEALNRVTIDIPNFMENPNKVAWHIENTAGQMIAKGNTISAIAHIQYCRDLNTETLEFDSDSVVNENEQKGIDLFRKMSKQINDVVEGVDTKPYILKEKITRKTSLITMPIPSSDEFKVGDKFIFKTMNSAYYFNGFNPRKKTGQVFEITAVDDSMISGRFYNKSLKTLNIRGRFSDYVSVKNMKEWKELGGVISVEIQEKTETISKSTWVKQK